MKKKRQYTELPDLELGEELDAKVRAMTELADRDIAEFRAKEPVARKGTRQRVEGEGAQSPSSRQA